MSALPTDPLAFDFKLGFESSAKRLDGERLARMKLGERALPFNHAFLDDYLRCIMPNDLIIVAAETGVGKTEMARMIAASNAANGKRVYYFALEAEDREIERRNKYGIIADLVFELRIRIPGGLNYMDWYRGALETYLGQVDGEADRIFAQRYATLFTYYRGSSFDGDAIRKLFLAHQDLADLIVIDHLHYIDIDDDNENRGFKKLVKVIRDSAIAIGKPVILVAHLKKDDSRNRTLVPVLDRVHGSSDITKIATDAVMLAPAWGVTPSREGVSPTFFGIPKARDVGGTRLVALCEFDRRQRRYGDSYTLGRDVKGKFEPLGTAEVPSWAMRHQPMNVQASLPVGGTP